MMVYSSMNIKYNHKRVHIEHANNKYFFSIATLPYCKHIISKHLPYSFDIEISNDGKIKIET